MVTHGAYDFDKLNKMPSYKYWLVKRSVDLEVIRQRKLFISDVATAFADPKKGITNLETQERKLEQIYNSMINRKIIVDDEVSTVSWDFPDDAVNKMKRWQR
jgi:hypothetical protein